MGMTSYIVWLIRTGHTPSFLKEYTLGTNAGWVMIGIMLWVATQMVQRPIRQAALLANHR